MRRLGLIGVDVSDSSIKVLQLDTENNIVAYGSDALDPGVVQGGLIRDKEAFKEKLHSILKNTQPTVLYSRESLLRAVLCLPESLLFTHFLELPEDLSKADTKTYIYDDAKKIIPFNLNELYSDYHIVEKKGKKSATFVGAPKENVDNYVDSFSHADVRPALIGGELFSLGCALLPDTLKEDHMIIDIGANNTNIGIFTIDAIANMSVTTLVGGEYITSEIAKQLDITHDAAEKLKRLHGLSGKNDKNGVAAIIETCLKDVVESIIKTRTFSEDTYKCSIKQIILAGGTALLPGLPEYIAKISGINTSIADPLAKIKNKEILSKDASEIFFANVVGLALRGKNIQEKGINLLTQYRYSDSAKQKEFPALKDVRSLSDLKYLVYTYEDAVRTYSRAVTSTILSKIKIDVKLILSIVFSIVALGFLAWVVISFT